jgi:hypothetical protein
LSLAGLEEGGKGVREREERTTVGMGNTPFKLLDTTPLP